SERHVGVKEMKLAANLRRQHVWLAGRANDDVLESVVHQRMLRIQNRNLRIGAVRQAGVPEISGNADDSDVRGVADVRSARDLQERGRPDMNPAADSIFVWEVAVAEFLADERDRRACGVVRFREVPASQQRDTHGGEEMCIRDSELYDRDVF